MISPGGAARRSGQGRWSSACLVVLILLVLAGKGIDRWVAAAVLPQTLAETSVEVRDRTGRLLRAYPVDDGIWRLAVRAGDVDPDYLRMLIAYEDKRFRSHIGVDPLAMLRAVGQAVWHRKPVSGGSTLTMQVARLLENGTTGRWAGKLRQVRLALALERRLTKDEILALYLTHAPFGGNLEGVRAASYAWFGKEPNRLTPAQSALLVALPQSPETRRPDRSVEGARIARSRVLGRSAMAGILPEEVARQSALAPLTQARRRFPMLAPHLGDALRAAAPAQRQFDVSLDAELQERLQFVLKRSADAAGPRLSAAMIVADHRSGEVIASLGAPDYTDPQRRGFVDMTRAIRSPGSTLKPLIYGLAFDEGLVHPETVIRDVPVSFAGYAPQNFDGVFRGDIRVRDALRLSLNTSAVILTDALGPSRLMVAMRQAGMQPSLPGGKAGLAVSLGGVGVSLFDLVQLYTVLAAGGQGPELTVQRQRSRRETARVMSPVAAWYLADVLRDLPTPGGVHGGKLPYKTGTSYGHRDAWAVGWDGAHVIGVWLGRADGTPVPGVFGADLAAPLLFEAFATLKPDLAPLAPPPSNALILGSAELPLPLQRFQPRDLAFSDRPEAAPDVLFPPEQARVTLLDGHLPLKLRGGRLPFTVLANGVPVARGLQARAIDLPSPGPGHATLVVIDADGQSARVTVEIEEAG
ncbi:penicillin-binding protein 1C [Tritonibacter horizontis]|uniref:peptidoglycan glycosyltransferase n=1 Tax=Tritonibacter horizontis TaxID=1768241 RepID=A0A132C167_9RHOB|nr:penicillin-binding protein 1C [Tritonibacter horizontis]KUP94344.1 penicillin-binding protein 1F [Tritonibacter horizontis]